MWTDLYLFCFLVGFFFSLASVVIGHLGVDLLSSGHTGDGGGLHLHDAPALDAHTADAAHAGDAGRASASPLNVGTIAAFLAWFGGSGYLITRFYGLWFIATLAMAAVFGLTGAYLVFLFLTKVLMREREHLNPADFEMIGVLGTVTSAIRSDGIGEILFSQDGYRRGAAARSDTGTPIPSGAEVVVTRYENGIAYVRRWEELAGTVLESPR
jgi:membrane protein implicated in regulation of membrane protease activity